MTSPRPDGLGARYAVRATRLPRWASALGLLLVVGNLVGAVLRGGPTVVVVGYAVFAVLLVLPLLTSRRAGEQVTCLEAGRVGTGTTSWRGRLEPTWVPWDDVDHVHPPGRFEEGVHLVLHDGTRRLLPGLPPDDGRRLAAALTRSREGAPDVDGSGGSDGDPDLTPRRAP